MKKGKTNSASAATNREPTSSLLISGEPKRKPKGRSVLQLKVGKRCGNCPRKQESSLVHISKTVQKKEIEDEKSVIAEQGLKAEKKARLNESLKDKNGKKGVFYSCNPT